MNTWELSKQLVAVKEEILAKLAIIDAKISVFPQVHVQVSSRFLPTLNALNAIGRPATATEVSQITGRSRAHESLNLNDLWARGLVTKEKQQKKQVFKVKECQKKA